MRAVAKRIGFFAAAAAGCTPIDRFHGKAARLRWRSQNGVPSGTAAAGATAKDAAEGATETIFAAAPAAPEESPQRTPKASTRARTRSTSGGKTRAQSPQKKKTAPACPKRSACKKAYHRSPRSTEEILTGLKNSLEAAASDPGGSGVRGPFGPRALDAQTDAIRSQSADALLMMMASLIVDPNAAARGQRKLLAAPAATASEVDSDGRRTADADSD